MQKKIVAIDDNRDFLEMLAVYLKESGYDVVAFENSRKAKEYLIDNDDYNLVITDIFMPDQDGFDIIQCVKQQDSTLPILAMTGGGNYITKEKSLEGVKELVNDTLEKPFRIEELVNTIKLHI